MAVTTVEISSPTIFETTAAPVATDSATTQVVFVGIMSSEYNTASMPVLTASPFASVADEPPASPLPVIEV